MFSWRCFPFVDSTPRAYRLKASNAAPLISTSVGTSPRKGGGFTTSGEFPLPCVTSVSTTSNLGLPRSVTSLGQSTLTRVLEGLLRRRIPQRRCAFFLEQSLLFPRR